ncbi:hypothetical protein EDB92DRAFT_1823119, partial [Lactarius akahatsu]
MALLWYTRNGLLLYGDDLVYSGGALKRPHTCINSGSMGPRYAILVFFNHHFHLVSFTRVSLASPRKSFSSIRIPSGTTCPSIHQDLPIVAFTTRDQWRNFQTYSLERRGDRNVPVQFLGAARWREYRGETGYFVDFASGPTRYRPVEFNFDHLCWVEITWNPIDNRYDAVRPIGRNYNCDIDSRNLPTRAEWGCIDGQPEEEPSTSEPRTPAPSETSGDDEETNDEESEVGDIIQTAESLRINEPENIEIHPPAEMATTTITEVDTAIEEARRITEEAEAYLRSINPTTGHRMTADDAAIFRAVGPDVADPPPGAGGPPQPRRPGGNFGQGPPGGRQPQFGGGGGGDRQPQFGGG